MKIQKLMVVLVILIMAVCITACGSKDSSDKCNCKEGACMKDGMCTEECKCPDMKDGMCPDDCMCMEDMDLSPKQAKAMYQSPSPLRDALSDFDKRETDLMDYLRDCVDASAN